MSNSKNKILIGVIAGMVLVTVVLIILIATGGKGSNVENNEEIVSLANDSDITSVVPSPVTEKEIDEGKSNPQITDGTDNNNNEALDVSKPEEKSELTVILGEYKGIEVEYSPKEITDDDILEKMKKLQDDASYYVNLPDRGFQLDDMVIITINVFADDKYYKDLSVYCMQLVIGNGSIPDFIEEEVIGKKIGDYIEVYHEYPEDFTDNPEFAGKTVMFDVALVAGYELYVPEITDTFIRENSEYNSVQEYKEGTKAKLQEEENQRAYEEMVDSIKNSLINNCTYTGIDYEIKKAFVLKSQKYNKEAEEYGFSDGATYYYWIYGFTPEEYQKKLNDEAELEVKYNLALDEIVEKEKLSENNPELNKNDLRKIAEQLIIDTAVIDG